MVGAARFELAALWSQTRCATRLRYAPFMVRRTAHIGHLAADVKAKYLVFAEHLVAHFVARLDPELFKDPAIDLKHRNHGRS